MSEPVTKAVFEATINPIGNKVDKIEEKIDVFLADQRRVENLLVEVKKDVENNKRRVAAIEKNIGWVVTTVVGAILLGLINFIVSGGLKK